jgi:GTPase SAR1 family protein
MSTDHLFKMVVIGDEGPTRQRLLDMLAEDSFEGDYLNTIGTDIHNFYRTVEGRKVRLIVWELANGNDFDKLRRAYYQNTKMVIISIEELTSESKKNYLGALSEVFGINGNIPVALVSNHDLTPEETTLLNELANEIDASQVITDLNDIRQLEASVDRLLREFLYTSGSVKEPYVLSLLRIFGLSDDLSQDVDTAIKAIRKIDNPTDLTEMIPGEVIHEHFKEKQSSLFIDIDYLSDTEYSVHIPEILEHRADEIRKTWINETLSGKMDLRYLWLTAYGFEVLRALKMGLIVTKAQFKRVEELFNNLGFSLAIRDDGKYPDSKMSEELKEFIWRIGSGI